MNLYLTFDDGPDEQMTSAVLEVLQKNNVPATFFMVAEKAQAHPALVQEILRRGHSIGNHSLDHSYSVFFKKEEAMLTWIEKSESVFKEMKVPTVGFRPPAGVRTPKLHSALRKLNIPLIMWNVRFFDRLWPWTKRSALRSLKKTQLDTIVLLHDCQRAKNISRFLQTLQFYIESAKAQGFNFKKLEPK